MKTEYDFSNSKPNPYTKLLKKEVKIKIDEDALFYFKNLAMELGIPYQNLINSYLRDCVQHNRKPAGKWAKPIGVDRINRIETFEFNPSRFLILSCLSCSSM